MIRNLSILILIFIFTGCGSTYPNLPTVKTVDLEKYTGTWYEIARYEHFFEKGCKNVTATYELKDDGNIKVINRCTDINSNEKKEAIGIAYSDDPSNSKLKVSFFRPFYGDYYILDLADDYSHVVVGSPDREYLWILARAKSIDKNLKEYILKRVSALGFDPDKFLWTIQE